MRHLMAFHKGINNDINKQRRSPTLKNNEKKQKKLIEYG